MATDGTALDRVSKALGVLEHLINGSTKGVWVSDSWGEYATLRSYTQSPPSSLHSDRTEDLHWDAGQGSSPTMESADANFIAILQRTAPVLVMTLTQAKEDAEKGLPVRNLTLALADMVLSNPNAPIFISADSERSE